MNHQTEKRYLFQLVKEDFEANCSNQDQHREPLKAGQDGDLRDHIIENVKRKLREHAWSREIFIRDFLSFLKSSNSEVFRNFKEAHKNLTETEIINEISTEKNRRLLTFIETSSIRKWENKSVKSAADFRVVLMAFSIAQNAKDYDNLRKLPFLEKEIESRPLSKKLSRSTLIVFTIIATAGGMLLFGDRISIFFKIDESEMSNDDAVRLNLRGRLSGSKGWSSNMEHVKRGDTLEFLAEIVPQNNFSSVVRFAFSFENDSLLYRYLPNSTSFYEENQFLYDINDFIDGSFPLGSLGFDSSKPLVGGKKYRLKFKFIVLDQTVNLSDSVKFSIGWNIKGGLPENSKSVSRKIAYDYSLINRPDASVSVRYRLKGKTGWSRNHRNMEFFNKGDTVEFGIAFIPLTKNYNEVTALNFHFFSKNKDRFRYVPNSTKFFLDHKLQEVIMDPINGLFPLSGKYGYSFSEKVRYGKHYEIRFEYIFNSLMDNKNAFARSTLFWNGARSSSHSSITYNGVIPEKISVFYEGVDLVTRFRRLGDEKWYLNNFDLEPYDTIEFEIKVKPTVNSSSFSGNISFELNDKENLKYIPNSTRYYIENSLVTHISDFNGGVSPFISPSKYRLTFNFQSGKTSEFRFLYHVEKTYRPHLKILSNTFIISDCDDKLKMNEINVLN